MRYQTLETSMIVIRSNPLHYKIVRFSEPKTRYQDKEFYRYRWVRCELFDSKTWKWKQLEEAKFPQSDLLSRDTNVSVNVSEDNKSKDIALVRYKGKLAITSIGREDGFMELWVLENYDRREWNKTHTVNIEALRRKEPYTRPVAFCNADIALMKEHDRCVTFFNITNGRSDRLSLEKNLNHGCFPFQSNFELSDLMGDSASKQVSDNTLL
ncbi:uncharacterized protein [Populus alba]|uniref:uncharacterized protein n=1 Tax=Populus alba TaxID=43335 RepID=UPI00158CC6D7|nr:uncharacterized protein LOC118052399 [Populus alba]